MGRRRTQTPASAAQAKKENAKSGSFEMLSNAKHDGVFYKKGEHVTLDTETQVKFAKLGLIDSASGVAAQPSDDQTQDANNQANTQQGDAQDGDAEKGEADQNNGTGDESDNS